MNFIFLQTVRSLKFEKVKISRLCSQINILKNITFVIILFVLETNLQISTGYARSLKNNPISFNAQLYSLFDAQIPNDLILEETSVHSIQQAFKISQNTLIRAKDHNQPAEIINAMTWMAEYNFLQGFLQNTQSTLFNALKLCEKYNLQRQTTSTLRNMGELYATVEMEVCALKFGEHALKKASLMGDSLEIAKCLLTMGIIHSRIHRSENALDYLQQLLAYPQIIHSEVLLMRQTYEIGRVKTQLGHYTQALQYHKQSLKIAKKLNYKPGIAFILRDMAESHFFMKDYHTARIYYEKAMSVLPNQIPYISIVSTLHLSEIYEKQGDLKKALNYLRKHITLKYNIYNIKTRNDIIYHQNQFENELHLASVKHHDVIQNSIIVGTFFFIVISLVFLFYQINTKKMQTLIHNLQIEKMTLSTKTMRERVTLLNSNLEHRNREITAKSMNMLEKQIMLKDIQKILIKMKKGEILFDNHIDELIDIITNYFKNNNWNQEFEKWFVEVHNDFYINLSKCTPDLTPQEIKICALIKIGMRNKEISHLLHIHEKTVEAHRIHIRKKLNLSRDTNLSTFMSSL